MSYDRYSSPLGGRYASDAMVSLWSEKKKFALWRRLWIALAESEKELGLPITDAQLDALRAVADDVDMELARKIEKEVRHDVMAHIKTFGAQAPEAAGIIHLGATSYDIVDNADLVRMREALSLVIGRVLAAVKALRAFALQWKDEACVGYTHMQRAQPTTVGKRACLWLNDFTIDLAALRDVYDRLELRGAKGATGTQGSFVQLFDGDVEKAARLDSLFAEKLGFERIMTIACQVYTRKVDVNVLNALSGVGNSAAKMATDVRLLQGIGELMEPFGKKQVGSSAMAYKRNPIKCERICALARHLNSLYADASNTASAQWLERSLDDSAARRIYLPESFLSADALAMLVAEIASGLVVRTESIRRNLAREVPFSATEPILMAAVKAGGDRQQLHEHIRTHAMEAYAKLEDGGENDLLKRIGDDEAFASVHDRLEELSSAKLLIGRASLQVEEFIAEKVDTEIERNADFETGVEQTRV